MNTSSTVLLRADQRQKPDAKAQRHEGHAKRVGLGPVQTLVLTLLSSLGHLIPAQAAEPAGKPGAPYASAYSFSPYASTPFARTGTAANPGGTAAGNPARPAGGRGHDCLIEPNQRIELRSPVEALIKTIAVDRGALVQKGQLLVELDAGPEQAALLAAQYRAKMQGQLKSAESRFQFAGIKHKRRDELAQRNFVSAQDRDEALAEKLIAEGDMIEAKDNKELAALEAQRLAAQIDQRRLRAPFTGVVTERLRHPGELAQTGENAGPILKLAQINPLRVEIVLPVSYLGNIKPGSTLQVEPEAPLKGSYTATVKVVDKVVDSASGTLGVRLELPNPDGSIPAGVKCRVKM